MIDPTQSSGLSGPGAAGGLDPTELGKRSPQGDAVSGKTFSDFIVDSLNEVNRLQAEADAGVQRLLTGETQNVAEVFAASNKAGIAFDLLLEIRNRLMEAYREIQQMRV